MSVKAFFTGAARIAVALFVGVMAIGVVFWLVTTVQEDSKRRKERPLAVPKQWPADTNEALGGLRTEVATMWRDGEMHYKVEAAGPAGLIEKLRQGDGAKFSFGFSDSNGFELFEHEVEFREFSKRVDKTGELSGLSWRGSRSVEPDVYVRAATMEVGWARITLDRGEEPSSRTRFSAPLEPWRSRAAWRMLRKGMSKDGIRSILGPPTKIETFSFGTWWFYGYPVGGRVDFDHDDFVEAWSEP
jgi:hypothetical protein